ncbi:MAG: DUF4252 domain-containing protein [Acidobacteriota bacterium]
MTRTARYLKPFSALIVILALSLPACGQDGRIKFDALAHLEAKASETVDVNVESPLLQLVPKLVFGGESAEEKTMRELVAGLKGVFVRHYEFEKNGDYTVADLDAVRAQARGWSKLVGIRSKRGEETVEVYTLTDAGKITALLILAAEPRELTIVNVIGVVDLEKLISMARHFGWLEIEIDKTKKE